MYTPRATLEAEWAIGWAVKEQNPQLRVDDESEFEVCAVFYCKSKRRRDGDNFEKTLWDACTGVVYGDDSQVVRWSGELFRGCQDPRTEVMVYRLGEE